MTRPLREAAPALAKSLYRRFGEDISNQLIAHFEEVQTRFGLDYPELEREEGVSFNPLQARLVSILFQMTSLSSPEVCIACADLPALDYGRIEDGSSEANQACRLLREKRCGEAVPTTLAAVYALDQLRHAHMRPLPSDFGSFLLACPALPQQLRLSVEKSYTRLHGNCQ